MNFVQRNSLPKTRHACLSRQNTSWQFTSPTPFSALVIRLPDSLRSIKMIHAWEGSLVRKRIIFPTIFLFLHDERWNFTIDCSIYIFPSSAASIFGLDSLVVLHATVCFASWQQSSPQKLRLPHEWFVKPCMTFASHERAPSHWRLVQLCRYSAAKICNPNTSELREIYH
jgi:hypothetical protein